MNKIKYTFSAVLGCRANLGGVGSWRYCTLTLNIKGGVVPLLRTSGSCHLLILRLKRPICREGRGLDCV